MCIQPRVSQFEMFKAKCRNSELDCFEDLKDQTSNYIRNCMRTILGYEKSFPFEKIVLIIHKFYIEST